MMMTLVSWGLQLLLGLASGIAIGGGVVALFIVLNIIPRLAQLTRSYDKAHWYEGVMVFGSVAGTVGDFWNLTGYAPVWVTWLPGLFCGVFIGMLAAALTEVLNVLPILAKRMNMMPYIFGLYTAMIIGKVCGSLFDWFVYYR